VDIGVHQDGLVHVSQLADRFVKDPNEVVKVHQKVEVTVVEVDMDRKRIALTMRKGGTGGGAPRQENRTAPAGSRPQSAGSQQHSAPRPAARPPQKPAEGGWFSAALKEAGKLKK
jgi:uncharacterized protein